MINFENKEKAAAKGFFAKFSHAKPSPPPDPNTKTPTGTQPQASSRNLTSDSLSPASAHLPASSKASSSQSPASSKASFFAKIKRIKNIEIYAAIVLIVVMIGIYMTTFTSTPTDDSTQISTNEDVFARELEAKLVSTLSAIKGVGKVDAMVTVVGSATLEIAYNIDEKTITQSGAGGAANTTTTIVKTPVIINGRNGPQPLVLLEIKPKLKGVVIVAGGANDIGVRLQILRAVQTLVADETVKIEVFAGK